MHKQIIYITASVLLAVYYLNHYTEYGKFYWELIDALSWFSAFCIMTVFYIEKLKVVKSWENIFCTILLSGILAQSLINVCYGVGISTIRITNNKVYAGEFYDLYNGLNWFILACTWLGITLLLLLFQNSKDFKK